MAKRWKLKNTAILEDSSSSSAGYTPNFTFLDEMIEQSLAGGFLKLGAANDYELIYSNNTTRVYCRYFGIKPVVKLSGSNGELVLIETNGFIESTIVIGEQGNTNSNVRTIIHEGKGIPGNTNYLNVIVPAITKINATKSAPSINNPFTVDIDNNPSVEVVELGTTSTPKLSLRFTGLSSEVHILKFNW